MEDGILIGEVCRQANCTPRTVRHYESEGLVSPAAKTPGGRKLYGKESVSVIRTAQLFKRLGCSLKEIRHIMDLTKSRNTRHRQLTKKLRKMLSETVSDMDLEMALLSDARKKIADLLEQTGVCDKCASEDCKDCGKLIKLRTLGLIE
jgi:DNA-binding transcriptional MerR regulator